MISLEFPRHFSGSQNITVRKPLALKFCYAYVGFGGVDCHGVTESKAGYIRGRGPRRETCMLMGYRALIFFLNFGENSLTKKSAKADVQLSLVEVCLVPEADTGDLKVGDDLRPVTDPRPKCHQP